MSEQNLYSAGRVKVQYNGETYETDYLDWYRQALNDGKVATPTWVIDINNKLDSDIQNNNSFYPVYATTMRFTSGYMFSPSMASMIDSTLASSNPMLKHNENVMIKPVMVVIPHGSCFGTLSDYQRRQTIVPITIKKFMNCNSVLMNHSQFDFVSAVINHVELLNGDEIAVIFTSYSVVIQERIWKNDGTIAGNVRKELVYNSALALGQAAKEGLTMIRKMV